MDFSKLKHNISTVPADEFVIDHYLELAEYKEFDDKEHDLLLRIAILSTAEKSPFVQSERDDYEKKISKIFAYLKITDGELFNQIITGQNIIYERMVNRYFIMCDNLVYVIWSDMFRNFHFIGLALREPPDMNNLSTAMAKRATLGNQQREIHKELVKLEAEIFPDTFTRRLVKEQFAKILQLPEKMAMAKQVI